MVRIREGEHPGTQLGCEYAHWLEGPACIRFYTNYQCIFCPAAREMLEELMREHELSVELIHEIDCDRERAMDVKSLPTIKICGHTIEGVPSEDVLEQALWKLRVNHCFISAIWNN